MSIESNLRKLRTWFVENTEVTDVDRGYIYMPGINIVIDVEIMAMAIQCWADRFKGRKIDAIVGPPDAGTIFALPLAMELGVKKVLRAKKGSHPQNWLKLGPVTSYDARTFTGASQDIIPTFIPGIYPGMGVLFVDDVGATGAVSESAIVSALEAGAKVEGFATFVVKQWQGATDKVSRIDLSKYPQMDEDKIDFYSLITVEQIYKDEHGKGRIRVRE